MLYFNQLQTKKQTFLQFGTFLLSMKINHGYNSVFFSPYDWVGQFIHDVTEDIFGKLKKKINCPGAHFSKVPKSFRNRNAIAKSRTLWLQSCFIHIFSLWTVTLTLNRSSLYTSSFRRIHFSSFRCRWTKTGFTGPKSFRGFRETGPRYVKSVLEFSEKWTI